MTRDDFDQFWEDVLSWGRKLRADRGVVCRREEKVNPDFEANCKQKIESEIE